MSSAPTLRFRLGVLVAVSALIALAGAFTVASALNSVIDARNVLLKRVDPSVSDSYQLLASLIDQETGARGYTLTRQAEFLEPYARGRRTTDRVVRRLARETAGLEEVDRSRAQVVARARAWQEDAAAPILAATRRGVPPQRQTALQELGKERFDAFRRAQATFLTLLNARRDKAQDRLDDQTSRLIATLIALAALVLGVGVALWVALRRWILRPLEHLGRETRRVSDGDLEHRIEPDGPPEVAAVAADVEVMRERIVRELMVIERANTDLGRSNAELEQFAYVASHDLQEPLRKIAGFTGMLKRRYGGQLDDRADQYIEFTVDGARRMQDLINDLLAFSRVGRTTERFEDVDLEAVLSDVRRDLEPMREEAGATIEADPLPVVRGDRSLLTAALVNLVGNAIKFRSEAPPQVRITCERDDETWRIAVIDNGIGIEPEYAERVFVVFSRLHTREAYEGTGIGLALVRKILQFHGGGVEVDTTVASGTTMRVWLPVAAERSTVGP